jgi:hypothetical protein
MLRKREWPLACGRGASHLVVAKEPPGCSARTRCPHNGVCLPLCPFGASATSGPCSIGEFIAFSDSQRFITKRDVKKVASGGPNVRICKFKGLPQYFLLRLSRDGRIWQPLWRRLDCDSTATRQGRQNHVRRRDASHTRKPATGGGGLLAGFPCGKDQFRRRWRPCGGGRRRPPGQSP